MNGKIVSFVLVLVVASILNPVDGACTDRSNTDDKSAESDSIASSVSNFFMEVGCSIKHGAKSVKDGVENGFKFIKSKVSSEHEHEHEHDHNGTIPFDEHDRLHEHVPLGGKNDPITFPDNDHKLSVQPIKTTVTTDKPITTITTQAALTTIITDTTTNNAAPGVTLDDRTALQTPNICPEGHVLVDDVCRKDSGF